MPDTGDVAQSVELILDPAAERMLVAEWQRLAEAGLPSALRRQADEHHRPHLTLYAADVLSSDAEQALAGVVAGLDLTAVIGALMVFGPRRGQYILVRCVVASVELLHLQAKIAEICGADPHSSFGPGRWSPHVTLARRMSPAQVGMALEVLGERSRDVVATVRQCRRWDGDRRRAWWLTT